MSKQRWRISGAVVLAVMVALGSLSPQAAAKDKDRSTQSKQSSKQSSGKRTPDCFSPSGSNINAYFGVSDRIIAPFCTQLRAGEAWTTTAAWVVAETFEAVPEGFVAAGATPMDDFLAKLSLKYVIDPGTRQERVHVFTDTSRASIRVVDGGPLVGLPIANTATMSSLHPLSVGRHVVETYWVFSAMHCDGLADIPEENCFPAGETLYHRAEVDVSPHNNS